MSALTDVFSDIADAIRSKNGSSNTYTPAQMPEAIENIPGGTDVFAILKIITEYENNFGRTITITKL